MHMNTVQTEYLTAFLTNKAVDLRMLFTTSFYNLVCIHLFWSVCGRPVHHYNSESNRGNVIYNVEDFGFSKNVTSEIARSEFILVFSSHRTVSLNIPEVQIFLQLLKSRLPIFLLLFLSIIDWQPVQFIL